jgi:uncharacterized protein
MWYNGGVLDVIEQHRLDIEDLCRRFGVKRLELFGSAARGDFNAESDIDFFVEFLDYNWQGAADAWFGLEENLEKLLGRKVELTSLRTAKHPYFLEMANRDRIPLYAAHEQKISG